MLVERIPQNEQDMIDFYRREFSVNESGSVNSNSWCDIPYLLREWDHKKSDYLYQLLGENLILTRHIQYEKSFEELQEEISDFTEHRYGRVGRSGSQFMSSLSEVYCDGWGRPSPIQDWVIRNCMGRLVSDDCLITNVYDGETFELDMPDGKKFRVAHGCKVSKALGKIAQIYNLPGYEDFRICHSQVLNQKTLGGDLTLSIHPLDYMTMSDNACGWESCMSWMQEGGYRQGTVEMMNSACVVVAYLTGSSDLHLYHDRDNDKDITWNSKKWRCLFVVNRDLIISIKDYPYHNSDLTKMVVEWIKQLAAENLNWSYGDLKEFYYGKTMMEYIDADGKKKECRLSTETGYMYNDFGALDFHWACFDDYGIDNSCVVANHYSGKPTYELNYSGQAECMACGSVSTDFDDESCLCCNSCQERCHCDYCDDIVDETYEIDGHNICGYCWDNHVRQCSICGCEHLTENLDPIFIVPRYTTEEQAEMKERFIEEHPFYSRYPEAEDCDEYLPYREDGDAYVCNRYHDLDCYQKWEKRYLKEGCHLRRRECRDTDGLYVYYDELNQDGLDEWCDGYDGSNDLYKNAFRLSSIYPTRQVEL